MVYVMFIVYIYFTYGHSVYFMDIRCILLELGIYFHMLVYSNQDQSGNPDLAEEIKWTCS
jgi:hypothetical protein